MLLAATQTHASVKSSLHHARHDGRPLRGNAIQKAHGVRALTMNARRGMATQYASTQHMVAGAREWRQASRQRVKWRSRRAGREG